MESQRMKKSYDPCEHINYFVLNFLILENLPCPTQCAPLVSHNHLNLIAHFLIRSLTFLDATDIQGGIGPAESLYMTEIPRPVPKQGEALVRVKAFGLNRADIMQRDGEYPVPPWASNILGLEFSGIIEELGEDTESSFNVGDEVFSLAYGGK